MMQASTNISVEKQINTIGCDLSESFRALFQQADTDPTIPQNLTKDFGTNSVFSHRLSTALRKVDPLATMLQIPGPQPLRRVLETAKKRGVKDDCLARASDAIDSFEHLIRHVAGDRSGLDLIIGAMLPDASSRHELAAKQLVYRGMRQLKGVAADVQLETSILYPSDDPMRLNNVLLYGFMGYRCLRPGATHGLPFHSLINCPDQDVVACSLEGVPLRDNPRGLVVDRFCSHSPDKMQFTEIGDNTLGSWDWDSAVGIPSSCDLLFAELRRGVQRRYLVPEENARPYIWVAPGISIPTKVIVADVLLAPGVIPDWNPDIRVIELGQRGAPSANDPTRDRDVFQVSERVEPLGTGVERFRAEDIPGYTDMLGHVCEKLGQDPAGFRGYRVRMEYPIFGTELQFRFKLPLAPGS